MKDAWAASKDKQYLGVEVSSGVSAESDAIPTEADGNATLAAVEEEANEAVSETAAGTDASLAESGTQVQCLLYVDVCLL